MKLATLFENESTELAKDYIGYGEDGPVISGASFRVDNNQVRIYQETDESEDGEEEPDKYYVIKKDVPIGIWKQFIDAIQAHGKAGGDIG